VESHIKKQIAESDGIFASAARTIERDESPWLQIRVAVYLRAWQLLGSRTLGSVITFPFESLQTALKPGFGAEIAA
jgi:hypothetical protein